MWLWTIFLLAPLLTRQEEVPLPLAAPAEPAPVLPDNEIEVDSRCFSVRPTGCPLMGETCRCRRIDNESAVCCHITSGFQLTEGLGCIAGKNFTLAKLEVYNATLIDLDQLSKRNLSSLTVAASRLERLGLSGRLTCLNISGNSIAELNYNTFIPLPHLEFLSLAGLNMTKLPNFKINVTLDLSGDLGLDCSILLQYLDNNPHLKFINENATFCSSQKTFHWFNSTELVPLSQVQILKNIQADCIEGCRCRHGVMDVVAGAVPTFSVEVDCSSMGLQALPKNLPTNTISLNVSYNNITCLDPLGDDASYRDLRQFIADSNQISSILGLEGSKFIDNFHLLSLRDNNIKSLPTYILSNTFDRNYPSRTVNLGLNKFSCNCSVAQVLKLWLLANKKHIPDYDQISCDNMIERVVELDVNKVCVYERDWTDYIYYIIAAEVGLLFLLIGKVSYDYWVFKTAGYLPWPASKMPKLPCDWVFE